jgi:hypothetical protein
MNVATCSKRKEGYGRTNFFHCMKFNAGCINLSLRSFLYLLLVHLLAAIFMRLLILTLFLLPLNSGAQNPYLDSLKYLFRIDEKLISKRVDTTICYIRKKYSTEDTICERFIICRNKDSGIIRIDKVFEDTSRYAYAYFTNGVFELMQWNRPDIASILEVKNPNSILTHPDIRKFYFAISKIPGITMPIQEKILH